MTPADDAATPPDIDISRGPGYRDAQAGDDARLAAATEALSRHVDDRWVQVADRVMTRALTATRRSQPVRAAHPDAGASADGELFVSEQVLITHIRHATAPVPGAAPNRVSISTDADHRCTAVTIAITVRYPDPIIPIADRIRARAQDVLGVILGFVPVVEVSSMHVHVSDVTTTDPHTGRPSGR